MCVPEGGAKSIHMELPFCSIPEGPKMKLELLEHSYTCSQDVIQHHEYLTAEWIVLLNYPMLTGLNCAWQRDLDLEDLLFKFPGGGC